MAQTAGNRRYRADLAAAAARLFTADLSPLLPFALLSLFYLALRIPYLDYGHGTDPDAWRVALTAHYLLENGDYFPSRLPGNPLHELLMTPLIAGGWVVTNLVTALASLLGVYLFARIVAHHRLPYPGLLTIGFAFAPLLYINSIATMDYMWTLTALLGAYYAALHRLPILTGVCLGLAIGFRLQSFIFLVPIAYLLWRQMSARDVLACALTTTGVGVLAFTPVLAVYGLDFFNFYDASVHFEDVFRLLGKEALGVIGAAGVLAGLAVSWRRLVALPRDFRADAAVAVWVSVVVLYFLSFFRLPHEVAYLIPVFPFGLLLMARYFTSQALAGAIIAILLAGVVDVTTPGTGADLASLRTARIGRGLILSNGETMTSQRAFVDAVLSEEVPQHSVVVTGFIYPQLAVRARDRLDSRILQRNYEAISMLSDRGEAVDVGRDVRYVWLLTYDTFVALRSQGYGFFVVPNASRATSALYGYRPNVFGATFFGVEQPSPSAGKGTANTDR